MAEHNPILDVIFYLLAAVIAVPLFGRFKLGAILGYLFAGVMLGPSVLNLIADPKSTLHFSEIGVVLLLFIIGLELNPEKLWRMRKDISLIGSSQMGFCTAAIAGVFILTLGYSLPIALTIGLAIALSSTAFAIQLMAEQGILGTSPGRKGFAILLFQDLAVIPILLLVQSFGGVSETAGHGFGWHSLLAVIGVLLVGWFLLNPVLVMIAKVAPDEVMTASALLIVLGTAFLMQVSGLSMGMGAFMAGILLANSSYRHQLEAEIEPFKGLLLGLFFIAIGMNLELQLLFDQPLLMLGWALLLMLLKTLVIYGLLKLSGADIRNALCVALMLSQGGEFAFVVMSESLTAGYMPEDIAKKVTLVVSLTMALTSPLVMLAGFMLRGSKSTSQEEPSLIDPEHSEVIIAGFGRFGQITGRLLAANGIPFTALDNDAQQVEVVKRFGNNRVFYGDVNRLDLLKTAGIAHARILVLSVDDLDTALKATELVKENFPNVQILARARNRLNAMRLMNAGADKVIRETFSASLEAASHTLESLGFTQSEAAKKASMFKTHDEALLENTAEHVDDPDTLLKMGKQGRKELEELFSQDKQI